MRIVPRPYVLRSPSAHDHIPEILLCFAPLALGFNYCGTTSIPVTVAYPSTGTKLSSSLP
jgi:hypothetical protein